MLHREDFRRTMMYCNDCVGGPFRDWSAKEHVEAGGGNGIQGSSKNTSTSHGFEERGVGSGSSPPTLAEFPLTHDLLGVQQLSEPKMPNRRAKAS